MVYLNLQSLLFLGFPPFHTRASPEDRLYSAIVLQNRLRQILARFNVVAPEEAVQLLERMLQVNPAARMMPVDIARSPFLEPVRHLWAAHEARWRFALLERNYLRRRHFLMFLAHSGMLSDMEAPPRVWVVQCTVFGNIDLARVISSYL